MTYSDVSRAQAIANAEAVFVMDEEAFRGFYDRNARGVWAYLCRVTGDRHQADDLLPGGVLQVPARGIRCAGRRGAVRQRCAPAEFAFTGSQRIWRRM